MPAPSRITTLAAVTIASLAVLGCEREAAAPQAEIMLETLTFLQPEVEAGDPLVLVATPAEPIAQAQPFAVRTNSGGYALGTVRAGQRSPWDALSPADLAALIEAWDNRVLVGFKEAGTPKGVDDQGRSTVSDQTVREMIEWVHERGVTVTHEFQLTPAIAGEMEGDEDVITEFRQHERIDYLDPDGPGAAEGGVFPEAGYHLLGVIRTGAAEAGLSVGAGGEVVAEYRQPDGTVLTSTALVR